MKYIEVIFVFKRKMYIFKFSYLFVFHFTNIIIHVRSFQDFSIEFESVPFVINIKIKKYNVIWIFSLFIMLILKDSSNARKILSIRS